MSDAGADGRTDPIQAALQRAVEADGTLIAPRLALAWRYHNTGRLGQAITAFSASAALDPASAEPWHGLGVAQKRSGLEAEAADAFRQALSRDPAHVRSLVRLAELERTAGRSEAALGLADRALALRPSNVEALLVRARIRFEQGHAAAATSDLKHVLGLTPRHPEAERLLAFIRRHGAGPDPQRSISLCLTRPLTAADVAWVEGYGGCVDEIIALAGPVSAPGLRNLRQVDGDWRASITVSRSAWVLAVSGPLPDVVLVEDLHRRAGPGIGLVASSPSAAAGVGLFRAAPLMDYARMPRMAADWPGFAAALASRLRCRWLETTSTTAKPSVASPPAAWLVTPHGKTLFGGGEQFLRTLAPLHRALGYRPVLVGVLDDFDPGDVQGLVGELPYLHLPRSIEAIRRAALAGAPAVAHVLSGLGYDIVEALEGLAVDVVYGTHFWRDMFYGAGHFPDVDLRGRPRSEFSSLCAAVDQGYANSAYTRTMIETHFDISLPIFEPLPFDAAPEEALPQEGRNGAGDHVLLANGQAHKGLPLVLDVARRLPAVRFRVMAPMGGREAVERQVGPRAANVEIVDWVPDTAALYRGARVVLAPSYAFVESFSCVALEAQRRGVPVVAADRGNLPLLLGPSGVCLPEDAGAWAAEVGRLFQDDAYHRRRASEARTAAQRRPFAGQEPRLERLIRSARHRVAVAVGSGIGNMIQCTPAIRRLAEHLGHPVDVLLNADYPGCGGLFVDAPWVGSAFPLNAVNARKRFDTVIAFDSFGALAPAFNTDRLVRARPDHDAEAGVRHEAEHNLISLRDTLDIVYRPEDVSRYFIGGYDRGAPVAGRIGLHAGGKPGIWAAKRWPGFAVLARRLADLGFETVCFGAAEERVPGAVDATGTSLRATIEAMRRCRHIIANDSGLMHVADALGTPLTALFGPSSVEKNGPLAASSQVLALDKPCAPCQFDPERLRTCRCIAEIRLETVLERVLSHLASTIDVAASARAEAC